MFCRCCNQAGRIERTVLASEARIIAAMSEQTQIIVSAIESCSDSDIPHWQANTEYVVGDIVRKGNDQYVCRKKNRSNGQNKPPNTEYWEDKNGE